MGNEKYSEDKYAQELVNKYGLAKDKQAVKTTPDGNCLFNAVSLAVCRNESLALKLRVVCCLQMVLHFEKYQQHQSAKSIRLVSPTLESACLDCAVPGAYSSAWTILALADVLNRPIRCLYPPCNGANDAVVPILSTTYVPQKVCSPQIHIMWSRVGSTTHRTWLPNHFVALFPKTPVHCSPPNHSSPKLKRKASEYSCNDQKNKNIPDKIQMLQPLPNNSCHSQKAVITMLTKNDVKQVAMIPAGKKENCFVVFNNQLNTAKRKCGQLRHFDDDCGAWKSGSFFYTYYLKTGGQLKNVFLKNNLICTRRRSNKTVHFEELNPQPVKENIIKLGTYYSKLALDQSYQRKISWIEDCCTTAAIAEYIGQFPGHQPHGNSKHSQSQLYMKTNSKSAEEMKDMLKTIPPKKAYVKQLNNNQFNDITKGPRNLQQMYNFKHNGKANDEATFSNVADEYLQVISMVTKHPFVQQAAQTKKRTFLIDYIHNKSNGRCTSILYVWQNSSRN
ncbi:uncharacterized protein LOC144745817 [Ciona intestinalis]